MSETIVRGTTPTLVCSFTSGVDLTEAASVYVTIKQGSAVVTKTGDSLDVSALSVGVYLSQADTLRLTQGAAEVQVNWTFADGSRGCSSIVPVTLGRQLLPEVLA